MAYVENRNRWGALKRLSKGVIAVVAATSSVVGIIAYLAYLRDKRATTISGVLAQVRHGTRDVLGLAGPRSTRFPRVAFGFGAARLIVATPDGVVLRDGEVPILRVEREKKKLLVSAIFINPAGDIVAEIQRNRWVLNPGSVFQRNFTDDSLEVIDTKGDVAIQLVLVEDTVFLQGIIRCRSGNGIQITRASDGDGLLAGLKRDEQPARRPERICAYPAQDYPNSCPAVQALKGSLSEHTAGGYLIRKSINLCLPPTDHNAVLADLRTLRRSVPERYQGQVLDNAIEHLVKALDPSLWVDEQHLRPGIGERVFAEDSEAVGRLEELFPTTAGRASKMTLTELIERLVSGDWNFVAFARRDQGEPVGMSVMEEQRQGNAEVSAARYRSAIEHYRKAWKALDETARSQLPLAR